MHLIWAACGVNAEREHVVLWQRISDKIGTAMERKCGLSPLIREQFSGAVVSVNGTIRIVIRLQLSVDIGTEKERVKGHDQQRKRPTRTPLGRHLSCPSKTAASAEC
ncbi:hypothetical protein RB195_006161 [Necator americanus]|uniref:Uncharacterized protein n=1 Tax=Necator americanus TaxID=51031 RepID=A0ABR1BV10_NECAM